MKKRRNLGAECKARGAPGAVKGERMVSELPTEYSVRQVMIHN
jgi:ribosomal protein S26